MSVLAYYDTIASGLVPCEVVKIEGTPYGFDITARVTADRRGYKRGETIKGDGRKIVPREAVKRFRGQHFPRILPYSWADYRDRM